MSNHLLVQLQRQHILLSYFKTLSVGPVWGSNPRPPAQQTGALPTELTRQFHSQDLTGDSPYCFSYSSYDSSLKNLLLDQLIISLFVFFFFLVSCQLDNVLIL